jgi:mannose-6-phosphate isomerase-like protein (cupin superfamily)
MMPSLYSQFIHLGLGATAEAQPAFTGMDWYEAYGVRTAADGTEGRLVSLYRFTEDWTSWEMHPAGAEVVLCVAGAMTVVQEQADGTTLETVLAPGDYAINAPGVWHTANVQSEATAVFITAGEGTEHRTR